MNETFKKLTAEVKAALIAELAKPALKDFMEATKAAAESGSFEVVVSTADIDRQGEIVDQGGWNLDLYRMNPVVLWAHDYCSLPIGVCESIEVIDGKLTAKGRFAPEEANPFAQQVRRLYDMGIVRATSVGFIPLDMADNLITKAELLEFSFVPVPANPYALSSRQAKELGIDVPMLAMKGLNIEVKEEKAPATDPAEGDDCTMEDGTPGTMQTGEGGRLVCMPKSAKATETPPADGEDLKAKVGALLNALQGDVDARIITGAKDILDIIDAEEADDTAEGGKAGAGKEKSGRVLSEKSRTKIQSIIDGLKGHIAALEAMLTDSEPAPAGEGEERHDEGAPNERSTPEGSTDPKLSEVIKGLEEFTEGKRILRLVNTATREALTGLKSGKALPKS